MGARTLLGSTTKEPTSMKRSWWTVLLASSAVVLTACGSTVQVTGSQLVPGGSGGIDATGATTSGASGDALGGTTTGTTGSTTGSTSGTGPVSVAPGSTGSVADPTVGTTGATTVTGPKKALEIGVLVTDTDSFQKAAGGTSYTAITRDAIHAYLKAAGSVAGHQLKVVDATFNYQAASYDNEFEAACQKFTKDHHVAAVIYDGITYNPVWNTCMTRAGVPWFLMHQVGTAVGDSTDMASFPGMITAGSVNMDRRINGIFTQSLKHGFLRAGSKLGVMIETCAYATRAYDRTLVPLAARNKVTLSQVRIDCGAGSSDHATGINAIGSAVLRFQTEGVDSVMFVTDYENGAIFYFAAAAEAQHYRPHYLLWANQGAPGYLDYYRGKGLGAQLEMMRGFGNSPLYEVTYPPAPPAPQAAARNACLATAKRQQFAVGDPTSQGVVLDACDVVNLLQRALALSGGQGGIDALVGAVDRLGTGFVSTMVLNGATRFAPDLHDGPALGQVSAWQPKCQCMAFIAAPYRIQ
jgi:hypothetical protein